MASRGVSRGFSPPARLAHTPYAHFLFENRSLVDFQIGHEQYFAHGVYFLFENQPMIDFQNRTEQHMPYDVHNDILLKNRPMIEFID